MLRIGQIEYANCTPIFHALRELFPVGDYSYAGGVPAHLNRLLAAGDIDVCPSSSIAYALNPDRYLIIPDISISSCGPVQSVLLFSTVPIEKLDGRHVLLSSESATSVNLLKILLNKRYLCNCTFQVNTLDPNDALKEAPALLLIGDEALRSSKRDSGLHVYDLGHLWYEWTGTPFVFALWLAYKGSISTREQEFSILTNRLKQSKTFAMANLEDIADVSPDAEWMGRDNLLRYWKNNLSFDLSKHHIEGLNLFFKLAAEMGLIEQAPELHFITP